MTPSCAHRALLFFLLAGGAVAGSAHAAPPILLGQYGLNFTSTCPSLVTVGINGNTGDVNLVNVLYAGNSSTVVGTAIFGPEPFSLLFTGQSTSTGGLLQLLGPMGFSPLTPSNTPIAPTNEFYSNDSTSIMLAFLSPINPDFNAFYVVNDKTGIARVVTFSNLALSPGLDSCTQSGTLTR